MYSLCSCLKKYPQTCFVNHLNNLLFFSCIPVLWWLSTSFTLFAGEGQIPQVDYVFFLPLVVTVFVAGLITLRWRAHMTCHPDKLRDIIVSSLLFIGFIFLGTVGIPVFLGRAFLTAHPFIISLTQPLIICNTAFASVVVIYGVTRYSSLSNLQQSLHKLLFIGQIPLPFLLFCLVPPPWQVGAFFIRGYGMSMALPSLLLIPIFFAELRLWQRYRRWQPRRDVSFVEILEPWCLASVIVFFKTPLLTELPRLPTDDFHFGEKLLPWQQWDEFGKVPYVDLYPVHGLVEFLVGGLNALFFNGTPEALVPARTVLSALLVLTLFLVTCRLLKNPLLVFLIMYTLPKFAGLTLSAIALFVLVHPSLIQQPLKWLIYWAVLGLVNCLFSFTSGVPFVLGSLPVAIWMLLKQFNTNPYALGKVFGGTVLLLSLLGIFTPFFALLWGLFIYIAENAAVNMVAYATPWVWGEKIFPDIIRLSYIGIALIVGVIGWQEMTKESSQRSQTIVMLAIIIGLSLLLFTPYTLGRIDGPGFSRTQSSVYATLFLLPVLLFIYLPSCYHKYVILVVVLTAGVYNTHYHLMTHPEQFLQVPVAHTIVPETFIPQRIVRFTTHALVDKTQQQNLEDLQNIFQQWLRPRETFLDLTNRNALYFYLNYPVPTLNSAFYNMPSTAMQQRALQRLEENLPPLVLISPAWLFDGVPASLRSHLIYRYFVLRYLPRKIGDFTFLITPERIKQPLAASENFALLDQAFRTSHLQKLPLAWGNSWQTLQTQCHLVSEVKSASFKEISKLTEETRISFEIEHLKLSGRTAGILSFDFLCDAAEPVLMRIAWTDAETGTLTEQARAQFVATRGRLVVPLDSYPRWLLAEKIDQLQFHFSNQCRVFSLDNLQFFQRNSVTNF